MKAILRTESCCSHCQVICILICIVLCNLAYCLVSILHTFCHIIFVVHLHLQFLFIFLFLYLHHVIDTFPFAEVFSSLWEGRYTKGYWAPRRVNPFDPFGHLTSANSLILKKLTANPKLGFSWQPLIGLIRCLSAICDNE